MNSPTHTDKRCGTCGDPKPLEAFSRRASAKDGRQSRCKSCEHEHYMANAERVRARTRQYYAANRDQMRDYHREYSKANSARIVQRVRAWRLANPGRRNEAWRRWYAAHSEDVRATYRALPALQRARRRMLGRAWKKANPDKVRADDALRRARKLNAPAVEKIDRATIWTRDGGICHLCRKPCNPKRWHLDHLVPLSLGGPHTAANVAVSHPRCNMTRGNRGPAQLRLDTE